MQRVALSDAVAFWEPGRFAYNGLLAFVVFVWAGAFDAWMAVGRQFALVVIFGAAANVLYCACYPLDLLAQAGPLREPWRRWRWIVWALGALISLPLAAIAMTIVAAPGGRGL